MNEPTFPLTFTGPWNEWQHVAPGGSVVRIREVRTGGCAGGTWMYRHGDLDSKTWSSLPSAPKQTHYSVSVNGRRARTFPSFSAALRKAKALVLMMDTALPVAKPAESPDLFGDISTKHWHPLHD